MKTRFLVVLVILCTLTSHSDVVEFNFLSQGEDGRPGLSPLNEILGGCLSCNGSGDEINLGIRYDSGQQELLFSIGYGSSQGFGDLTGPAFSWLLHGPATVDETSPVIFDLMPFHSFAADPTTGGTIVGSVFYDSKQESELFAGLHYVNIYTEDNLGGEIRGQLIPIPEPTVAQIFLLVLIFSVIRFLTKIRARQPQSTT